MGSASLFVCRVIEGPEQGDNCRVKCGGGVGPIHRNTSNSAAGAKPVAVIGPGPLKRKTLWRCCWCSIVSPMSGTYALFKIASAF